jgi:hypothetical protein
MLNYNFKALFNTFDLLLQARRPSLLASLTIRQALAGVIHCTAAAMALHLLSRLSIICSVLQGFGWAIAKALAEAGAEISLGVWVGTQQLNCCSLLTPAYSS